MGKSRASVASSGPEGWRVVRVAWGWCGLRRSERGLAQVSLPVPTRAEAAAAVGGQGAADVDDPLLGEAERLLAAYFTGKPVEFALTLDLQDVGEFAREVLAACARIPRGVTATYGELAAAIGRRGAARAVGQALGRNPLPVVIPCHRVVGAGGRLVGFGAGLELKRRLLELEGVGVDVR